MNSLSWFLYAADVMGSVKTLLIIISFLVAVATAVLAIGAGLMNDDGKDISGLTPWITRGVTTVCVTGLLMCFVPSERTFYMIAASQVGERAVHSSEGQEIKDLLMKKVREVLSDKK